MFNFRNLVRGYFKKNRNEEIVNDFNVLLCVLADGSVTETLFGSDQSNVIFKYKDESTARGRMIEYACEALVLAEMRVPSRKTIGTIGRVCARAPSGSLSCKLTVVKSLFTLTMTGSTKEIWLVPLVLQTCKYKPGAGGLRTQHLITNMIRQITFQRPDE